MNMQRDPSTARPCKLNGYIGWYRHTSAVGLEIWWKWIQPIFSGTTFNKVYSVRALLLLFDRVFSLLVANSTSLLPG